MNTIILASASPRRKELLEKHNINPVIIKPDVDENINTGFSIDLSVEQTVMYLALKKSFAVKNTIEYEMKRRARYLIAADTVVYDGNIIGKPKDTEDAFRILKSLKGKMHRVFTGVAVIDLRRCSSEILCDESRVYFKNYTDEEINEYISKECPLDKAGAYAIQTSWGNQVEKIEGNLENIIGLPWYRIEPLITV